MDDWPLVSLFAVIGCIAIAGIIGDSCGESTSQKLHNFRVECNEQGGFLKVEQASNPRTWSCIQKEVDND